MPGERDSRLQGLYLAPGQEEQLSHVSLSLFLSYSVVLSLSLSLSLFLSLSLSLSVSLSSSLTLWFSLSLCLPPQTASLSTQTADSELSCDQ